MFNELFFKDKPKWKFIENNYGNDNGLDSTDMETFKKDPIASLARESCQNSVDAQKSDDAVLIQFKVFYMNTKNIPGINDLFDEIKACRDSNVNGSRQYIQFNNMLEYLKNEKIPCLRISDFNTKGLGGVRKNSRDKAFYRLTKGNGQTTKEKGINGGSKGIGKFASFVNSQIQTVFYSTFNTDNEKGFLGISKLASRPLGNELLCTTGYGYYSKTEKVLPILEDLNLDKNFKRTETGTDIYILGFKIEDSWKKDIITKVLDSFMCAIQFGKLGVEVDDVLITKDTLKDIVYDEKYINGVKDKRKIISQYILLNNDYVHKKEFNIDGYGNFEVYIREFNREEEYLATKKCAMIRYPYMKIKDFNVACAVPCSALCIIPENKLNKTLIDIENPQHTDWEYLRLNPDDRKSMRKLLNELERTISEYANECLLNGKNEEIDMEGAGDLLPDLDNSIDISLSDSEVESNKPRIISVIQNKVKNNFGEVEDENAISNQPDIGTHIDDDVDEVSPIPEGHNEHSGADVHDSQNETGYSSDGNEEIMKEVSLSGIKSTIFILDKKLGKYAISFNSIYDEENCEIEMYYLDDSDNRYKALIKQCTINGQNGIIDKGKIVNLKLKKDTIYKIEVYTNLNDIYACEVKLYAIR